MLIKPSRYVTTAVISYSCKHFCIVINLSQYLMKITICQMLIIRKKVKYIGCPCFSILLNNSFINVWMSVWTYCRAIWYKIGAVHIRNRSSSKKGTCSRQSQLLQTTSVGSNCSGTVILIQSAHRGNEVWHRIMWQLNTIALTGATKTTSKVNSKSVTHQLPL